MECGSLLGIYFFWDYLFGVHTLLFFLKEKQKDYLNLPAIQYGSLDWETKIIEILTRFKDAYELATDYFVLFV